MPSIPPVVADYQAEVAARCARTLADVGLYLDGPAGVGSTTLAGLRRGLKAVGVTPAAPLTLSDPDVAALSPFAAERVVDEAVLYALEQADLNWYRALQRHGVAPEARADDTRGGWIYEERAGLKAAISQLKSDLADAYREPSSTMVSSPDRDAAPTGYPDRRPYFGWGCY